MTKRIRKKEKLGTYNVKKLTRAKDNNKNLSDIIKKEKVFPRTPFPKENDQTI